MTGARKKDENKEVREKGEPSRYNETPKDPRRITFLGEEGRFGARGGESYGPRNNSSLSPKSCT